MKQKSAIKGIRFNSIAKQTPNGREVEIYIEGQGLIASVPVDGIACDQYNTQITDQAFHEFVKTGDLRKVKSRVHRAVLRIGKREYLAGVAWDKLTYRFIPVYDNHHVFTHFIFTTDKRDVRQIKRRFRKRARKDTREIKKYAKKRASAEKQGEVIEEL